MKRMLCLMAALALAMTMLVVPAALADANDNWLNIFYTDDPETLDVMMTTDSYRTFTVSPTSTIGTLIYNQNDIKAEWDTFLATYEGMVSALLMSPDSKPSCWITSTKQCRVSLLCSS